MANETPAPKKKRGRPPKAKPEATAVEAKVAAEQILVKPVPADYTDDFTGVPTHDPASSPNYVPQDHLPGSRPLDALDLPEFAYDEDVGRVRRITRPTEYHYCWVEGTDVDSFKHRGYMMVQYNGGDRSGLDGYGFKGTTLFTRTQTNWVQRADVYLMYCPIRLYEEIVREDREFCDRMRRMGQNNFMNLAYKYGIQAFTEVNRDPKAPPDDENARLYN